jgi:hypothetical protein
MQEKKNAARENCKNAIFSSGHNDNLFNSGAISLQFRRYNAVEIAKRIKYNRKEKPGQTLLGGGAGRTCLTRHCMRGI